MTTTAQRITQFAKDALGGGSARARVLAQADGDVVIVSALRTPITRARKGGLAAAHPEDLLAAVLKGVLAQSHVDPALVEDVVVGNVLPPGGGATAARMAALAAGIPHSAAVATVNRQCSSGLFAVNVIAGQIATGQIELGIGAGVESMTHGYGAGALPKSFSDAVLANEEAADCLIPMGITSENVAEMYNLSRADQDAFAAESFVRAARAQKEGWFDGEIVPVTVAGQDDAPPVVVNRDDGVREGVTAASLAKLKPAFKPDGSTHAGNASQVSDGAAAVLLARRSTAQRLGLRIIGKFVAAAAVGVPPKIMGVGPAYAIPRVLAQTGLTSADIDFFEINEAFASQALWSVRELRLDPAKVNPHGGAIALGHPLGATGARQIATGLNRARRTGEKIFVTSMCVGSGMGMAAVFVSEQ